MERINLAKVGLLRRQARAMILLIRANARNESYKGKKDNTTSLWAPQGHGGGEIY
ncbi:hypothetical protein QJS10_CPB14g00002 [Acorus calamus]|uniref:Ribosomal protein L22 n=1 Tax=Acorus calamus TaxID=4465 RepID=A0AAV9DDA6_ACOCL|nr:hypothetical protein QJS10_CPB14g00002 [Acorus calamus]